MLGIKQKVQKNINILIKLLPIFSFAVPFLVLYLDRQTTIPYYSFEITWKGRTFYIFFLWLALLEMILSWEALQSIKANKLRSVRTVVFLLALLLPSFYLIASNYYGFSSRAIIDWSSQMGLGQPDLPLGVEYFILAALFVLIILLQYGVKGLKNILISPVFLITIGAIYTIDSVYRYGRFTPFQALVPATATLAAGFLNLLGYQTTLVMSESMPLLYAHAANSTLGASAYIAWPCSGIESLIIYTVTILLFLKKSAFSVAQKVTIFVIGAIVTYMINILRIATIFIIAINTGGMNSSQTQQFHNFYGQLYSMIWIISYLFIIIGSQAIWEKFRNRKSIKPVHPDPLKSHL
jgi:thaumarchaeosortase